MRFKDTKLKLSEYLKNKPIFYKKFDFERFPKAYANIKDNLENIEIIHIVGTNGKGSTGRFLAQILENSGFKVGHFTSPHIFKYNERFYKNGKDISDDELEKAHQILQNLLPNEFKDSLSYFEYATFLAAILFKDCDFIIMEAGMGGEFDSTNVFKKKLSIFTPIDLDHTETLGKTIKEISLTKLRSMDKFALLNDDMNEISVKIAKEIALKKTTILKKASELLDDQDREEIANYALKFNLPKFQISNLTLSYGAAKFLSIKPNLSTMPELNLKGRLWQIKPNLIADVGHNPLGAKAVVNALSPKKYTLIYNSFLDKDYKSVLEILSPIVNSVLIYEYKSIYRELAGDKIMLVCNDLGIKCGKFTSLKNSENYLVFGSFMLIEEFLKNENFC